MSRPPESTVAALLRREVLWSIAFVAIGTLVAGVLSVTYMEQVDYREGQTLVEPVVARVAFEAVDHDRTDRAARRARGAEPNVYRSNTEYLERLAEDLDMLREHARRYGTLDDVPDDDRNRLRLGSEVFEELRSRMAEEEGRRRWDERTDRFLGALAKLPVVDDARIEEEQPVRVEHTQIVVIHDEQQVFYGIDELLGIDIDASRVQRRIESLAREVFDSAELAAFVHNLVISSPQPLIRFDEQATRARRDAAYEHVIEDRPIPIEVRRGYVLAEAGERLTPGKVQLLTAEMTAYYEQLGTARQWMMRLAAMGMVLAIFGGLWLYLATYNPRIIAKPMRGFVLLALLLLGQGLAVGGLMVQPDSLFIMGLFPTLLVAIVLVIAYDQRFALAVGAIHALLVTLTLGQSVGFLLTLAVGVAVAVRQLADVRSRSKLVWVGLWTGLALMLAVAITSLIERPLLVENQMQRIGLDMLRAFGTALATGILVQALLPAIERIFNVTTAMTLKELQDASHPLLRRLAESAPGTYQHSLRLADMAESAAEAINADSLLCKVGALYHDIGKINKPAYFIENQARGHNRHDKLSPAMSLLIIVGHVKDGVEMAREYGLPRPIRHFIESHHGTTLVEYFYNAAREQSESEKTPAPTEFEFRYPGPKPETREAAILMLCDGIESAARSLSDPTPTRLEQLVHTMAQKRLMDGQFDECNLTLKELHRIEQAIHRTLCAIYHGRIAYPGQAESPRTEADSAPEKGGPRPATGSTAVS